MYIMVDWLGVILLCCLIGFVYIMQKAVLKKVKYLESLIATKDIIIFGLEDKMKNYEKREAKITAFTVIKPKNNFECVGEILSISIFGEYCPINSLRGYELSFLLNNPLNYRVSEIMEKGEIKSIN